MDAKKLFAKVSVCGAICALAASLSSAAAADIDAAFDIIRKGERVGYHVVQARETADGLVVETRVELKVKFGPLPLYRYRHVAVEHWRDGELQWISSKTNDNGERAYLEARRENGVLIVDGAAYQGPAPMDTMPASYWNRSVVSATTVLNTQDGELIAVETSRLGATAAPFGGEGEQFRVVGTVALDVWYDGENWIGFDCLVDGEELTYRRVEAMDERERLLAMLD
ncbi:MAG: DUF6134 family protein [Parvularculaceae bacterium]